MLCVRPIAGDVDLARSVDAKDVPQVGKSNRRTAGLSARYEGDVGTRVDLGDKTRTGAAVMIQPCDHGMKLVMSPLTLELLMLFMQVGTANSVKKRGSLVKIVELDVGVIVLVARESNNVLFKDERFYFFCLGAQGD